MMGAGALQPSKVCQQFCSAMAGNLLFKHPPFVSAFLNEISFIKKWNQAFGRALADVGFTRIGPTLGSALMTSALILGLYPTYLCREALRRELGVCTIIQPHTHTDTEQRFKLAGTCDHRHRALDEHREFNLEFFFSFFFLSHAIRDSIDNP
jgi:hypothetical protein